MSRKLGDAIPLERHEMYGCQACNSPSTYKLVVVVKEGGYSETQFYCSEHIDVAKEHLMDQHNVGTCDWCKGANLIVKPHRDFEEGSSGPIYDVCAACRTKESDSLSDETGWDA